MFRNASFLALSALWAISLDLRLLARELVPCSVLPFPTDLAPFVEASEGVAITLESSFGELEGLEEECLR